MIKPWWGGTSQELLRKKKVLFYKMLEENRRNKVYENAPGSLQSSYNNLTMCNHITLVWDRAGFDVCLLWYKLPRNNYRGSGIPGGWAFSDKGPCGTSTWRRNEGFAGLHALLWAPHWKRTLEKWKKRSGWSSVPDVPVLRGLTLIG